jgi:hypothetical protein
MDGRPRFGRRGEGGCGGCCAAFGLDVSPILGGVSCGERGVGGKGNAEMDVYLF